MGVFVGVTWSANDAVTSTKLQRMCDNIEYVKDAAIAGRMVFPQNTAGKVASGRTRGVSTAKKIEAISFAFDSTSAVTEYDFRVPLQPVFSEPPIISTSLFIPFQKCSVRILRYNTSYIDFRVSTIDNNSLRMAGEINIVAVGV